MSAIKGIFRGGRLELEAQPDWPDGTEVLIEPTAAPPEKLGLDESEWRDDAKSLADWEAWIRMIQPLEFTPDEAAKISEFNEQMRRHNVEAVCRPMKEGADG